MPPGVDGNEMFSVLAVAVLLELTVGEPPAVIHPVVWMGRIARRLEGRLWSPVPKRAFSSGMLIAVLLPGLFAALGGAVWGALRPWPWALAIVGGFLLKSTFSVRALDRAAADLSRALAGEATLSVARAQLSWLCSRDASELGTSELAGAAIESVAENTNDSVVAPLLFFALFGLPGALLFRTVNTLDAMIGYRGRHEWFGKASARLDDFLGWIPARCTAALLMVSGGLCGRPAGRAWKVGWAHHGRTESPNAGWPMAVMAGLLDVQLDKPGHYVLGSVGRVLDAQRIGEARRVVRVASGLAATLAAAAVWGLYE